MKIKFLNHFLILLASASLATLSGCAAVAVGGAAAGTVAIMSGDTEADLKANLTQSIAAVDSVIYYFRFLKLEQINLVGEKETITRIKARDPDDNKVTIKLRPENDNLTHISIRVGSVGKENRAEAILSEIQRSLVW